LFCKLVTSIDTYYITLKNKTEIVVTGDGSHTLFNASLKETYHSTHGAVNESMHVFIDKGFKQLSSNERRVLEVGFGTGLNALLTCVASGEMQKVTWYQSFELNPLQAGTIEKLNYPSLIDSARAKDYFQQIHDCPWNRWCKISPFFYLLKIKENILHSNLEDNQNIVYYDAFAPSKQPELWSFGLIRKLYDALCPGGIIVTYTAKGEVRRNLIKAGFRVEKIPGPPGKREMLRGFKDNKI